MISQTINEFSEEQNFIYLENLVLLVKIPLFPLNPNVMNNSLFKILSPKEKNDFLKNNGLLLMSIHLNNQSYCLYSLGSLYVEVTMLECKNGKEKIIKRSQIIEDLEALEPYLHYITLDMKN